ncbi:BTB/POZ domain-containing protein 6-B-like [Sitodiplosis mosellana]|uniref:BTB/POZ domain-containing protein 6-B-like n=1 Tax=Sitodiplosis mosellana TaxID=263140 RepID=UPI0024445E78|nr:BTB/POZ domain-containing protein 6-B-like [Sitodiplosis mosellana]
MASQLKNTFVAQSISKLYLNAELCDVKFVLKDHQIPAHKYILAVASPVFNAMFFGPIKEEQEKIEIVDATINGFKEFIQFFYLGEVTLTMEHIVEVARLADKYDMIDCMNMCAEFLESQLTETDMFWGYQLAITLGNEKLKQFCAKQISVQPLDIFKTETFLRCDQNVLRNILEIESLQCSENDIFKACLEWAKCACDKNELDQNVAEHLKAELGDCFYLIRFGTIPTEEFAKHISNELYKDLFTRDELADVLCATTVKDFKSTKFSQTPRTKIWNTVEKLICDREQRSAYGDWGEYPIKNVESTRFSTNIQVLLGEFNFALIKNFYNSAVSIHFNVSIDEVNAETWITIRTLFSGKVTANNESIRFLLPWPLIIDPKKTYEIRFEHNSSCGDCFHTSTWQSFVKIDEELTVTFHQNPNDNQNNEHSGLVSKMFFSRI